VEQVMAIIQSDKALEAPAEEVANLWALAGDLTKARRSQRSPALSADPVSRVIQVDARFERSGVWSGVDTLMDAAYLELSSAKLDHLIDEHDYELYMVLLTRRDTLRPKYMSLTDTSVNKEKTRRYALDRAYRIVNGLVGLMFQWKRETQSGGRWVIVVRNFDQAQHLSVRFFTELTRRAALHGYTDIEVVVETRSDVAALQHRLPGLQILAPTSDLGKLTMPAFPDRRLSIAACEQLDHDIENDSLLLEQNGFALLDYHRARGDAWAQAQVAFKLLPIFIAYGYYYEAKPLIDLFMPFFDKLVGDDDGRRGNGVSHIAAYVGSTAQSERIPQVVEELALPHVTKPRVRAYMYYILAIYHSRNAEVKNLLLAEKYFMHALDLVEQVKEGPDSEEYSFLKVFMDNGLAYLRVKQGRHEEAINLCTSGYEYLTGLHGHDRHRLHRSVLQYNIGQVYVMLNQPDNGIEYYKNAMTSDPYYTEYYNDIGNVLQESGRYSEAIEYFRLAIKYSPPYPEVYHNKGLCHARQGELEEALSCFDFSIELDPTRPETYALRAEVLDEMAIGDEALTDYDTSLSLKPDFIAARVNRAILYFGQGAFDFALSDMNHVIALDGEQADHYSNRAEIFRAMNRQDLYEADLVTARRYEPAI
jgi:tetratricopeptide (TPR) repeat protein